MKAVASFRESGIPWHDELRLIVERLHDEKYKSYMLRVSEEARRGFTVLAGKEPNIVIVTEETFAL